MNSDKPKCPKCGSDEVNVRDTAVGFSRDFGLNCYKCGNQTPMLNMMNTSSGYIGVFGTHKEEFSEWYK
jgi:predicted nucleic-acid-binding Zn-ribbon protein